VLWAAFAGLLVANLHIPLPEYLVTSAALLGQISVPLMLFALGIRLMEGAGSSGAGHQVQPALPVGGGLSLGLAVWLLPLEPDWIPL
jgi:predicted permease